MSQLNFKGNRNKTPSSCYYSKTLLQKKKNYFLSNIRQLEITSKRCRTRNPGISRFWNRNEDNEGANSFRFSPLKGNWFDSLLSFFPYISSSASLFSSSREIAAFEFWTREKSHSPRARGSKNSMAITREEVGKFITRFLPLTRATSVRMFLVSKCKV